VMDAGGKRSNFISTHASYPEVIIDDDILLSGLRAAFICEQCPFVA